MIRRLLPLIIAALLCSPGAFAAADAVLVGTGQNSSNSVTTSAGVVSAGDTILCSVSFDASVSINSATVTGSGSDTLTLIQSVTNAGAGSKMAVYRKENATGGASVSCVFNFSGTAFPTAYLVKATGVATASYDSGSLNNGTDTSSPYTVTSGAFAQANNVVIALVEENGGSNGSYASSNFTMLGSDGTVSSFWTHGIAKLVVSSTSAVTPSFTRTGSSTTTASLIVFGLKEGAGGGGGGTVCNPLSGRCGIAAPPLALH